MGNSVGRKINYKKLATALIIYMTNLFHSIPASKLCNQHLVSVHNEIHQEDGTKANHPYGDAVVEGHWKLGQVSMEKLGQRHKEVVKEMQRRGMNHESPLKHAGSYEPVHQQWTIGFPFKTVQEISLATRCDDCDV